MAAAIPRAPNGRMQRDRAAEVPRGAPARRVVGDEAELDCGAAATGAEHGGRPRARTVADEIETARFKHVGQVLDEVGRNTRPEARTFDKPPPQVCESRQAASLAMLSSAQSRRGETSPRPVCRASTGHGSPSPSCS